MFNGRLWNSKNSNVNRSALTLQAASANDNIGKRTALSMKAILETFELTKSGRFSSIGEFRQTDYSSQWSIGSHLLLVVLSAAFLVFVKSSVFACSCAVDSMSTRELAKEMFRGNQKVAILRILSVTEIRSAYEVRADVTVIENFKGATALKQITTNNSAAACGVALSPGQERLFRISETNRVSLCSNLFESSPELISALRQLASGK